MFSNGLMMDRGKETGIARVFGSGSGSAMISL